MKKLKMNYKNTLTFKEGYHEFIFNCLSRNLRDATVNHYDESYKQIIKYFDEEMLISDITKDTFNNFVVSVRKNKEIKSQTLHTYCRDLKTIIYFFMKQEYIPNFKIQLPKVDRKPIETYTDEELEKLLKKPNLKYCSFAQYRDYCIISFFLSTGIRLSSLINVRIKDINFADEEVNIMHTKNRKPLTLPLNNQIIKILKEYLNYRQFKSLDDYLFCTVYGKQLSKSSITQAIKIYNNDRGVNKTSIHCLRHTFAKKWILAGKSVVTLQKALGHSRLDMTQNYINILVSDLKEDMNNYNILQEFNTSFIKIKRGKK